ncbi:UNVERIFIED_CONTAM: hypothetical protein FKN15_012884 [Acipenser sinensis]
MKLEAVMENLQRQQAARLALEEKLRQTEKEKEIRSMVETQIKQQALAFRHYQAAVRGSFAAAVSPDANPRASAAVQQQAYHIAHGLPDPEDADLDDDLEGDHGMEDEERDLEDQDLGDEGSEDEAMEADLPHFQPRRPVQAAAGLSPKGTPVHVLSTVGQPQYATPGQSDSPTGLAQQGQSQHHEWTYEEQFKQVG